MKRCVCSLIILFAAVATVFAQGSDKKSPTSKAERDLLEANKRYDEALVSGDVEALERIYGDEFTFTNPSGDVLNKSQNIELFRSGAL